MENVAYTVMPPETLTQEEWMSQFRVGIMAPKQTNNRAKEIMDMWSGPDVSDNPFRLLFQWLKLN